MANSSASLYEELAKQILPHLIKELEKKNGKNESTESIPGTSSPLNTIKTTEIILEKSVSDAEEEEELNVDAVIKEKFGRRPRTVSTLSTPPPNLEEHKEMLDKAGSVSLHQLMNTSSASSSLNPVKLQESLNRYRNQSTSQSTGPGRTAKRINKNTKPATAQLEPVVKKLPELNKHIKVFFLGDSREQNVPIMERSLKLQNYIPKLGEDTVALNKKGDGSHFRAMVRGKAITKGHDSSIEWKPLYVIGAGKQQPLQEFDNNEYPSVGAYAALKKNTLYLQPNITIIPLETENKKKDSAPGNFPEDETDDTEQEEATPVDDYKDIYTIQEFRFQICDQLPKRDIEVNRMSDGKINEYLDLVHELARYNSDYDILQIPIVNFTGESGYDSGGVTREYFYQLLMACIHSNYHGVPLFEGPKTNLVPTRDVGLLKDGVYHRLTRMLVDSSIHYGVFMIGLSQTIIHYLLVDDPERVIMWEIETEEIPEAEAAEAAKTLERYIKNPLLVTEDEMNATQKTLIDFNFGSKITEDNACKALYCLKFETVIGCRVRVLEVMREIFRDSPIYKILNKSEYLKYDVFPHPENYKTTVEQLLSQFAYQEEKAVIEMIRKVGLYCRKRGGDTPSKLLQFLNGSPVLDNSIFTIKIIPKTFIESTKDSSTGEEKTQVQYSWIYANVCARELMIPAEITQEDLEIQLDRCLQNNLGFGRF